MAVLRVGSGLVITRLVGQVFLAEDIFYGDGSLGARSSEILSESVLM